MIRVLDMGTGSGVNAILADAGVHDCGCGQRELVKRELVKDDWHVRYFTFRMTPWPGRRICQS